MRTTLTVAQAAQVFQESAGSMFTGAAKFAAGLRRFTSQMPAAQNLEFFTPRDNSPFGILDQDKEDFTVGVSIPKAIGSGGGNVVVHLYTWDRQDYREIRLRAPSSIGSAGSTRKALDTIVQAYQAADSRLDVHGI